MGKQDSTVYGDAKTIGIASFVVCFAVAAVFGVLYLLTR